jgi:DNA primase
MFPAGFIDEVRGATSIARVVEDHVPLKRAGRTLKGLCPFHSEKTPSFHVDEAKGFYHCFGCGAGGDAFKFVMQLESLSFPEAVRQLAERAGIRVPDLRESSPQDELRERLLAINAAAQEAFAQELTSGRGDAPEALAYLKRRGVGSEVVATMGLGFAPDGWRFLGGRLGSRFLERELTASGLLVPSDSGRDPYDRFRKRITFPIRATSERIVAFGGRILGDGEPKYLNGPETPVYTKGRHLFALDRARTGIRKTGFAIVVEGYLDAISLHAHGVDNAVAVLGTALTSDQAKLLSRFTRRVVLCFDGDSAGQRATQRSIPALLAEGCDVRVLTLPDGIDPDDHVRKAGGDAMRRAAEGAGSFLEFLLGAMRTQHDLSSPVGRVAALNEVLPLLASVSDPLLRSELVDATTVGLGLRAELVRDEVRRALRQGQGRVQSIASESPAVAPPISHAEGKLIAWMLADPRARRAVQSRLGERELAGQQLAPVFRAILEKADAPLHAADVVERLSEEWQRRLVSRLAVDQVHEPVDHDSAQLDSKIAALVEQLGVTGPEAARRRKAEVDRLMTDALRRGDREEAHRLAVEAQELGRAINS